MVNNKNSNVLRGEYLSGYGLGTLFTPVLLQGLGVDISLKSQIIVWVLGVVVLITGIYISSNLNKDK